MSIKLGSTSIGSLYLGSTKIGAAYLGSTKIYESSVVDPLNPLGLPPYTIRVQLAPGKEPGTWATWAVQWTQVSSSPNVWDGTRNDPDWSNNQIFLTGPEVIAILGFNATGITNFNYAFNGFTYLSSVCLFDTSAVTDMNSMFDGCIQLTSIPLFDTSSVTDMRNCFRGCYNVQSGALALYQQASTQTTPPSQYADCFYICGKDTQTGAAELAQIPQSWGGTADPYNPLNLPAYTVRVKLASGYTPSAQTGVTHTLVDATENIWDYYKSGNRPSFSSLFVAETHLLEVLGANSTGVQYMDGMFSGCSSLTAVALFDTSSVVNTGSMFKNCSSLATVPLFDTSNVSSMQNMFNNCSSLTTVPVFNTSNVSNMNNMFSYCSSLTTVPLFNTSNVSNMSSMFLNCSSVASGALALYTQASSQAEPPDYHTTTFKNCGSNTQTGAAELAQIPQDWGGTGA